MGVRVSARGAACMTSTTTKPRFPAPRAVVGTTDAPSRVAKRWGPRVAAVRTAASTGLATAQRPLTARPCATRTPDVSGGLTPTTVASGPLSPVLAMLLVQKTCRPFAVECALLLSEPGHIVIQAE